MDNFKSKMMSKFETSYGFLSLEVYQVEDDIFISQRKYAKDILSKFSMLNCKPTATPMNINEKLQHEDEVKMTNVRRF